MRNIKSSEELKDILKKERNIELISDWNKNHRSEITCKCYCGNIFTATVRRISENENPCGCIKRNKKKDGIIKYLKETKNIEVVSDYDKWFGHSRDKIKVKCFCGNTFESLVYNLKNHKSSCGCLVYQYKSGKNNYMWKGAGELSAHLFSSMKSNAKQRNKPFDISIDYAWELFLKQNKKCTLSGVTLQFNMNHNDRSSKTASLCMIDETKGYVKDNVMWIHKTLTKMKMNLSLQKFVEYCSLISNPLYNESVCESVSLVSKNHKFNGYMNIGSTKFKAIERGARERNLCFDITIIDMWNKFVEQRGYCAMTGLPIYFAYKNDTASLDRIDSNGGYTLDNIQWVHSDINIKLKQSLSVQELKNWCKLVYNYKKDSYEN